MSTAWRVLSIDHRDPASFEEIVRLIDAAGTATAAGYSRSDVVEALREGHPAVVAVGPEGLVGVAVARVAGRDAHPVELALHPQWRNLGIGSALLKRLDEGSPRGRRPWSQPAPRASRRPTMPWWHSGAPSAPSTGRSPGATGRSPRRTCSTRWP